MAAWTSVEKREMGGFKIDFGGRTERLDGCGVERKAGIRKNSTFSWKVHGWGLVMPFAEKGNWEEEWLERKGTQTLYMRAVC